MLDRVKNGSPYLGISQQVRLKSRTIRKDLPVGRIHTQLYIKLKILIFALCHGDYVYGMLHGLRIPK